MGLKNWNAGIEESEGKGREGMLTHVNTYRVIMLTHAEIC